MSYKIKYLTSFQKDYDEIIDYLTENLAAPGAAASLTEELFKTVDLIALFPYSRKLYELPRPLSAEYRTFMVKNYTVFYAVDEENKTLRLYRMLYGRRDFERLL